MIRSNNFVVNLFNQVFALFDSVYSRFGAWSYVIGAFIVYTLYRLILAPAIGGGVGSSDTVKKIRREDKENK